MLFISHLVFTILLSQAETVSSGSASGKGDRLGYVPPTQVLDELTCMQEKDKHTPSMFKSANAKCMIKILAPYMERSLKKIDMGPKQRALFYSQVIVESGAFTHLSESSSFDTSGNPSCDGRRAAGSMGISQLIKNAEGDATQAKFRGRGLIQLTRCDNYISALHYVNLQAKGQSPYWQPYWNATSEPNSLFDQQIGAHCTPTQMIAMKTSYRAKFHMPLDPYGLISNPENLVMVGGTLTNRETKSTMEAETLMVDMALAYWRGRCGTLVDKAVRTYKTNAEISQAVTKCVRGSTESWEERNEWFEIGRQCVKDKLK
jgi:hypothetical protein